MKQIIPAEQSRVLGVARTVTGKKLNAQEAYSRRVILTGDAQTLRTENGRWCFIDALRLLCRVFGDVLVVLPAVENEFRQHVAHLCASLWSRGRLHLLADSAPVDFGGAHSILHVGAELDEGLPRTCINANGWVARVNSGPGSIEADCRQENPIAALMAAALGVTEVFKRVFEVPSDAAPLLSMCSFSLWELNAHPCDNGPVLPVLVELPDTVLFGAGAIGNAVALLISQLRLSGRLHVVDKQDYGIENGETCTQIEMEGWFGSPKAERLVSWLKGNSGLTVTGEKAYASDAIAGSHIGDMNVDLVLNALDDVQARHDTQVLWPALLIDGGINQIGAGVVQNRLADPKMGCLICTFELPSEDLATLWRKATGLHLGVAESTDRQLTAADIEAADPAFRDALREAMRKKRTVCSIISEGVELLRMNAESDFQPSAPFVAAASAALMVAEALKGLIAPEKGAEHQFLIGNLFIGPETGVALRREPRARCNCVKHRALHEQASARRAAKRGTLSP